MYAKYLRLAVLATAIVTFLVSVGTGETRDYIFAIMRALLRVES